MGVPVVADHQLKVPVVRRPSYTIYLEQSSRRHCFIHCDVHATWSAKVQRELRRDWETLKGLHGGPFLALHDPEDPKHQKFLRLFGFRFLARAIVAGRQQEIHTT